LKDKNVRALLVNIFGGITRCDIVAQALVELLAQGAIDVPVVARLVGTNASEGRQLLEGSAIVLASTMSEAAERAVALASIQGGR